MDTTAAPPARPRRLVRWALAISLALNLLIVGLVLGAVFGRDRDGRRDSALEDIGFNPFVAALPASERLALGRALVDRAGDFRQNREALRGEFDRLIALLRAEPFDLEAVRASVEAQQARLKERQDLGRDLLFERLAAMTSEQRAAFADALERGLRWGPRGRGHHGPGD
jgi:uncharacterized membrane protein